MGSDMCMAHLCSKQTIHYSCCTILLNAIAYNVLESAGVLYRLQTVNHVTDARIKVHKLDGVAPLMTDPPPTSSTTLHHYEPYFIEKELRAIFDINSH